MEFHDSDSDSDPVVATIELFHASSAEQNFLLQFPLMSCVGPQSNIEQATYDDETQTYQFRASLPSEYNISGEVCDSILQATQVDSVQPAAIGLLVGGQLHLVPIETTYQARPIPQDNPDLPNEISGQVISLYDGIDPFTSRSEETIASNQKVSLFADALTGMKSDFNPSMANDFNETTDISIYSPRELLYLTLVTQRYLHFGNFLEKHNLLQYEDDLAEMLLRYAYYIQGRWVVKSEHITEANLPRKYHLPRNFVIVVLAYEQKISREKIKDFINLFGLNQKEELKIILTGLAVLATVGDSRPAQGIAGSHAEKALTFIFKPSHDFELKHHDIYVKAKKEILKLKASIEDAQHNPNIFDDFL